MKALHKSIGRGIALLLACVLVLSVGVCCMACASSPENLMTLGSTALTRNQYEFFLSRMRGTLALNGASTETDTFWNTVVSTDGTYMTNDAYFTSNVLYNTKLFLAGLYLFSERGLQLSDATVAQIDKEIRQLRDGDADGNTATFNSILSAYGLNETMLRELYLAEEKIEAVKADLYGSDYSLLSTSAKDAYAREHYVHYKQIVLANFRYVPETDVNGDVVYYYTSGTQKDHVCYDTVRGTLSTDLDENGDVVYYLPSGKIAYDTVNGSIAYSYDENGYLVTEEYTDEEKQRVAELASEVEEKLKNVDAQGFEALIDEYSDETDGQSYFTDGYYLSLSVTDSAAKAIVDTVAGLEIGETACICNTDGYRFVMRYEIASGAYQKTVNEVFFTDLCASLAEELFTAECAKYAKDIVVDEEILKKCRSISEVKTNLYY